MGDGATIAGRADDPEPTPTVGRVLGTEDSTPLQFHVALQRGRLPAARRRGRHQPRRCPGSATVTIAGVVTEVTARHEGASFGSDVFLISDGVLPARVQETAEITTTRVEPECYVPPRPGEPVRRATGDDRDQALYFDQMDRKLPVGTGRDGSPIYLNLDFLDGTRGAHISISGISGVATKTSYALFLLHSLFRSGVLGTRAVNAKALVFSVKGEDLLFLDYANIRLDDELRDRPTPRSACPPNPSPPSASTPRPPPTTSPAARTSPAGPAGSSRSGGRCTSSAPASCCPTSSPTPRTNATSTRWSSTRSPPGCGWTRERGRQGRRASASTATPAAPTTNWSTSSSTGSPTTPPARMGRAGHRGRHHQRVHPPAALVAASRCAT